MLQGIQQWGGRNINGSCVSAHGVSARNDAHAVVAFTATRSRLQLGPWKRDAALDMDIVGKELERCRWRLVRQSLALVDGLPVAANNRWSERGGGEAGNTC